VKKFQVLIGLLFLLQGYSFSGESPVILKQIASEEELSHAWVTCLSQDFLGFIWIGTSDGLYRYDGYEIKTYRSITADSLTLLGNNITAIYEDKQHNLWIGTNRGLSLYDRNYDRFFHREEWPKENISDILEGEKNEIYFGTYNGLFIYDADTRCFQVYHQYTNEQELYDGNQVLCLLDSGRLLVSGPHGLEVFSVMEKKFMPQYRFPGQTGWVQVNDIASDYKGILWVTTRETGLFYLNPSGHEGLQKLNLPGNHYLNNTTLSILQTSDSMLWVGTENNGIVIVDLKKFYVGAPCIRQVVNDMQESALLNNSVYSLFEDTQGNIWIGTYGGLNLFNTVYANFNHIKASLKEGDLSNNIVNTFFENGNELWIGTEGGINILDKKDNSFSYLSERSGLGNSLSSDAVYVIARDQNGYIWIGTWAGGLNRYDPESGRITQYLAGNSAQGGLSNNNIFSLVVDEKGILWVGTMGGGLNRYDPSTGIFRSFVHDNFNPESIANNWIRHVFLDSRNRLWVSTYNSLEIMDRKNGTFHHFFHDDNDPGGISDNGAIVIFEDSKRHIWLGTSTGLNLYNEADSVFTIYTVSDGLPSDVINAVLEDDEGNLWLSTNNGIAKFTNGINIPQDPDFFVFDIKDGLQSNKFNQRSAIKSNDGTLYFGGKNGFSSFHPATIKGNQIAPPVLITEFLVFNKKVVLPGEEGIDLKEHISLSKEIQLKYKYRVFTINFVALNYIVPEKNQYRYILEGFEEEWNDAGNRRSATYTNLDPGEYVFKVIASNNSLVWNTEGVELKIKILPPWYRTFWAYSLYTLFILFIVLIYRRFILIRSHLKHEISMERVEKEKLDQLNKMKSRFFTNISHEFRTPLTLILGPLDSLVSDISQKPRIIQKLAIIQKNARRMLRLINQLLDISEIEADHLKLKVREGDIVGFIKEIASLFRWLAAQRNISYTITANHKNFNGYFDSDKIEKMTYNLLANAFKYTPDSGNIEVDIEIINPDSTGKDTRVRLSVKDSGVGIRKEDQEKIFEHFYRSERVALSGKTGSGIGLALVRGLIGVYRGEITVESEPGSGSRFTIVLPVSKEAFREGEIDDSENTEMPLTVDIIDLEHGLIDQDAEHGQADAAADSGEKKEIILVVEDNEDMRRHITGILSNKYQVIEAEDGKQAFAQCEKFIPDLVISDIRMPGMDGIELCHRLKSDQTTSHIPLILLTAKATPEDRLEGILTGADSYITKPFENKLLMATVKNLLSVRQKLKEKYSRSLVIEPTEISITSVDEKFLRKAIAIVEKNIANADYSVDTFSKDIGMSRSHLHRKFVGLTGHSPSGFIRTLRMKRAAQLLTKGQLTVSEILFEVGIKSRSYFTKSFKEQFGYSPTDFVSRSKENSENKPVIDF
jgi:signal transduction histidine kinase/ligand-binding sensor domain-containing protein/AraC-like DNA-binding protein